MAIEWRTVMMMLPRRRFTAAELQRAIPDPPSLSLKLAVALNLLLPVAVFTWSFDGPHRWALGAVMLAIGVLLSLAMARAWGDPGHRFARWTYFSLPLVLGLGLGLVIRSIEGVQQMEVMAVALVAVIGSLALWFAIVYRHQFIERRLVELDERDRRVDMARQLAQAQIQPHFLYNSLASLQHWVQVKDDRAAPMLDALTGFLRATLPLFDQRALRLGDEAQAVRAYCSVMQLRLGPRLAWQVDIDEAAAAALLPPGLLLTLVENAIEHGATPSLSAVQLAVKAQRQGKHLLLEVRDTGVGLAPDATDGVGLGNARARLAQAFGHQATLTLQRPAEGGCLARIECPLSPETP
jgi:Histidine kinase